MALLFSSGESFPRALPITAIAAALLITGCAHLDYIKVPTPTQYQDWSDEQQQKADKMKGVRYYLPRPYLVLKQSTPVAQRTAFISFHWDPQKDSYVLDLPESNPHWVSKIAPKQISITQALAITLARAPKQSAKSTSKNQTAKSEGTDSDATQSDANTNGESAPAPSSEPSAPTSPSELHGTTGYINANDPVTRLGERFDIVYLPDFEEQYVIQPHTGLGTAEIETRLRNGWAAETFSQKVDNSKLVPYVIDQVSKASKAAADIVTTWAPVAAGLPPGSSLPFQTPKNKSQAGNQKATSVAEGSHAAQMALGNILMFKIAEVRVAQPGVYPILKPREMTYWLKFVAAADTEPDRVLDSIIASGKAQWVRPDVAYIPCPPFTMIGFNTTTDIFLTPVTERLEISVVDRTGENGDDDAVSPNTKTPIDPSTEISDLLFRSERAPELWGEELWALIDTEKSSAPQVGNPDFLTEIRITGKAAIDKSKAPSFLTRLTKLAKDNGKSLNNAKVEADGQTLLLLFREDPASVLSALRPPTP